MGSTFALRRFVKRLFADRRGATAVEYAFIIGLVFLALLVGLSNMANVTIGMWGDVSNKVVNAH